ncbi:MAG TPA: hypothetical protein VL633_07265 [Bacteroidota bacterium]|jgi:hypothetical protein|nr:hypothetical protein [Bacteroidota bacterium]
MRSLIVISCALFVVILGTISLGHIQSSARADDKGSQTYYTTVSQYYRVPERQVVEIRDRKISDEEIPVVFFIARKAHVEPMEVVPLLILPVDSPCLVPFVIQPYALRTPA